MNVIEHKQGVWFVSDRRGNIIAGPFHTNGSAWAWVDNNSGSDAKDAEKYRRIGSAITEKVAQ